MAALFIVLLWRAFRGFCWTDESFYISTADRFYRGVTPLLGEWYRTQMSSVLMVPFYAVYRLITGGTDGIVLYFRLLYLVLSSAAGLVWFRTLRRHYPDYVALVPAIFMMCYAHLNNATFSYYMLSYILLSVGLIMIYDCIHTGGRVKLIVAGSMIALAVFCMPLFAVGYFAVMAVVIAAVIAGAFSKRTGGIKEVVTKLKLWNITEFTVIGVLIPAALFAVWFLLRADIGTLARTLPYALVDNEHTNTFGYYIRKPHRSLLEVFGIYTYAAYLLCAFSFLFQKVLKKHPFCDLVIFADVLLFALMTFRSFGHTGYIQVVLFICMVPVFFVSESKNHRLFWLFSVPGVLVAVIYCFASSDFLYVMAIGCALAANIAPCVMYDYVHERGGSEEGSGARIKASRALLFTVCLITVGITFILRMKNVYRDAPIPDLTEKIPYGVAKGLYTTPEHLRQYADVYEVIDKYCMNTDNYEIISGNPSGNVLFSKILPWGYIAAASDCGYPTTWRATAYNEEQLDKYYGYNPQSIPDLIIVLDEEIGSYDAAGDTEDDHNPNLDEMSDYWKDYIEKNGFTNTRYKCATIYGRLKDR